MDFAKTIMLKLKGDNAGKNARPLKALCEEHGITIDFIAPNMPQRNGVVEQRIAVLTQRANTMMTAANLNEDRRKVLWRT